MLLVSSRPQFFFFLWTQLTVVLFLLTPSSTSTPDVSTSPPRVSISQHRNLNFLVMIGSMIEQMHPFGEVILMKAVDFVAALASWGV